MNRKRERIISASDCFLELKHIHIKTPGGRPLFKNLNMSVGKEKVAIVGRNGVGKSTLLKTMAGCLQPLSGKVVYKNRPCLVSQQILTENEGDDLLSWGSLRKRYLMKAKNCGADMLLLDEPTEDLDAAGISWLFDWIPEWENGLIVVSHDRLLLSLFKHFFIISESGCTCFSGSFNELSKYMDQEANDSEKRYVRNVQMLDRKEEHRATVIKRRQRKKNYGRISELERCTPKQRLNKKRSGAQVSQGKAATVSRDRIEIIRNRTHASRRALPVSLPLELSMPTIDIRGRQELVCLANVSAMVNTECLFKELNLTVGYERIGIIGPNGAGKSTLLNIIKGDIRPSVGSIDIQCETGSIDQGGMNWMTDETLMELLFTLSDVETFDEVATMLVMHKFPIALAHRPLNSLSPGERVRAALLCLFQQRPTVQLLVLDEPTYSLDFAGETALRSALNAWPGGLIVVSHNQEFLSLIAIHRKCVLDGKGGHSMEICQNQKS